jgi:enamine deaminase RidA (YjgF/YER057c/UK114 family)
MAGQIGWNESQQLVSSAFAAQFRQALQNIVTLLAQAGGRPEHLVRPPGSSPTSTNTAPR